MSTERKRRVANNKDLIGQLIGLVLSGGTLMVTLALLADDGRDLPPVTVDPNFTPGVIEFDPTVTFQPLATETPEPIRCIIPDFDMRVRNNASLVDSIVFAQIEQDTEHEVLSVVSNDEGEWVRIKYNIGEEGLEIFVRPVAGFDGTIAAYVVREIDGFEYFGKPELCSPVYMNNK